MRYFTKLILFFGIGVLLNLIVMLFIEVNKNNVELWQLGLFIVAFFIVELITNKVKPKAIILDNNELSILSYAEEYPENWKRICNKLEEKE